MNALISKEELLSLTGYKRKAEQYRFLIDNGLPVKINAAGDLLVHRAVAESWLGYSPTIKPKQPRKKPRFDLA